MNVYWTNIQDVRKCENSDFHYETIFPDMK